ncbi:hypothetical protein A3Q56_01130 [Intoshia linei]|uniref:SH3 domain-containing protein n=1 Tax=Intoshia linei TaxID=1819745 RepID=A0A177BA54_9BILA|nr:hypothetical protein A3Q56_01130 [Intoshia linei]
MRYTFCDLNCIYLDDIKKYKKKFSDIYQYDCLNLIFSAKKPFVYEDNELLCNKKTINVILDVSNEKSIDYLDNITTIITRKLDIKEFMPIKENYDVIRYINDYLSLPTIGCTERQCTDIEKKCKIKNCDEIIHKSVKPKNEGKPTSEENNYKTKYLYIIILACSLVLFITIIGIGIISLIFFQKKQERRVPRVKSIKRRRHGSPGITKINLLKINTVNRDIQKMGVTMYDFKPSDNEEVVCKKGDIVRILEEEIKVGWYIIKTKTGYIGCIPEEFINIIYISNAELKKLGYDGVEDLVNEFDSDNCDYTCSLDDRHSMGRSIFEKIPESKRCSTIHHTNKDGQYRISRISITNNRQLSFIQSSGEIGDYLPKSHDSEYSEGSEQSNDIVNKISSILSMRNSTAIKALSTKRASYVKSAILDRLNIEPRNSDSGKTLFLIESASEFDDDL